MPIFLNNPVFLPSYTSTKLPPPAVPLFESKKYDEIEDLLLTHMETMPEDLSFFIPVIRTLVRNKQEDRAATILQMLCDMLVEQGAVDTAMGVMHAALEFWPRHAPARAFLCGRMKGAYGSRPDFARAWRQCDPEKAADLLAALTALELWFVFCEGTIVYMPGAGPGRVTETNPVLDLVRVHMAVSDTFLSFKPNECNRSLVICAPGQFMYDRVVAPQSLIELAASDPARLLQRIFADMKCPLTQAQIKEALSGIVAETKWTAWWNKVKGDRRLSSTIPGGKGPFTWNETESDADAAVIRDFTAAPVRKKLEMAAMLAGRGAGVAGALSAILATTADALRECEPGTALEIELCRECVLKDATAAPSVFLMGPSGPELVGGIQERVLRKRALAIIREQRADWQEVYSSLIHTETDASLIAMMFDALAGAAKENVSRVIGPVLASPSVSPRLFAWVVKEMPSRNELGVLADAVFVNTLLASFPDEVFKPFRNQLAAAFESGGAAYPVVQGMGEDEAKRMLSYLERIAGLDDEFKRRLTAGIHAIFPQLHEKRQPLIAADAVYCLPESLEQKHAELEKLVRKDLVLNAKEIQRTREYGDLRENFEYHAARARQELLSSMAKTLHDDLARARVIDLDSVNTSCVSVGTRIRLVPVDGEGEAVEFGILGKWESDPAADILSHQAKAVAAMLGKKVGDEVEFNEKGYRIEGIGRWEREGGGEERGGVME